jgi:polyisoprenoid-binding protein YceI
MRLFRTILTLAAFALPSLAADYNLELKPENTKIQFTLTDPIHTVHGAFNVKRGNIEFSTDTGKASGQVIVDVASGNSGSDARDSRMQANVLESKKFPEASFIPDRVDGALSVPGTSTVKVHGTFTIHGTTHELTMEVQSTAVADQIHATMAFDIPYVSWGMKDPSNFLLKVNKTVRVTIETTGPLAKR